MNYSGMTVNERIFEAGLEKGFDEAVKNKDRKRLIELLKIVDLDQKQSEKIAESLLG